MFDSLKKGKSFGSVKLGESRVGTYPEGFAEGSLTWPSIARLINETLADAWFEAYEPQEFRKSFSNGELNYDQSLLETFAPFLLNDEEKKLVPSFNAKFEDFGEQQKLDESELGKALISNLQKLGVNWFYETAFQISPSEYIELPDAHDEGIAQWGSYFGMPLQQRFRVYKDTNGVETCVWFSTVLAATRQSDHIVERDLVTDDGTVSSIRISDAEIERGVLTFGKWSTEIFIPILAKKLFYLSETPFPSNIMNFPRSSAYDGLDENDYPDPVLIHTKRAPVVGAFDVSGGSNLVSSTRAPDLISMGWSFTTKDFESQKIILETITNGLIKITSFLEDGFLNYNDYDSNHNYPFDQVVLSATVFNSECDRQGSRLAASSWVPAVRMGLLLNETNVRGANAFALNSDSNRAEAFNEFNWVANEGAGAFVPNCTNSLVFSWLIPQEKWLDVDRVLESVVRLDYGAESTNAMSNWGIAKYKQGLLDEASKLFESALEQPDKFAEAEASFYMAKIWTDRGDPARATMFQSRCDAAGGYSNEPEVNAPSLTGSTSTQGGLLKPSSGLGGLKQPMTSTESDSTAPQLAKFCSNCGERFEHESSKFCSSCGAKR